MKVGSGIGRRRQGATRGFVKHGHQVMLGTRDAGKLADFVAKNRRTGRSFADAASTANSAGGWRYRGAGGAEGRRARPTVG